MNKNTCFQDHMEAWPIWMVAFKTIWLALKLCMKHASKARSGCPSCRRETKIICWWMGIILDPFMLGMVKGHLLHFKQKPLLVKLSYKCKVKIPKAQEAAMSSEIDTILSEGTILLGLRNRVFHIPLYHSQEEKYESFHNSSEAPHPLLNMHLDSNSRPEADQGGYSVRAISNIAGHLASILWHPSCEKKQLLSLLYFRWKSKIHHFRTLPFSLSRAPEVFTRLIKPILLQFPKMI